MKILVACEYSGRVREAFRALGHDAWSCDLLESEDASPHHIIGDCLRLLADGWDMMIAHPPCTYLASSGLHWNGRVPGRAEKTLEALEFVRALLSAPIPRIALENPVGCISSQIRKPDQTIQPWQFGEDASKATCLWLKGLPLLTPTQIVEGQLYCCGAKLPSDDVRGCANCGGDKRAKRIYANQTASGQNNLAPSPDRWKERSRTYQGIADAMAAQWGMDDSKRGSVPARIGSWQTSLFGEPADVLGIDPSHRVAQRMVGGNEGALA